MIPPLEETFAGNEWRVVDDPSRGHKSRFVVVGKSPATFGEEVEICAVQYRPHAEAIAALPEMAIALKELNAEAFLNMAGGNGYLIDEAFRAIAKAEGRANG